MGTTSHLDAGLLDVALYVIGLSSILTIFLPFSPMTIDLVNFPRGAQIAIYRRRWILWSVAGACLGALLLRGVVGLLAAHGALDAGGGASRSLGSPHAGWLGAALATTAVMALLFWTGYVPWVMTPPSRRSILAAAEADAIVRADDVVLGLVLGGQARAYLRDGIARPHYFTDTVAGTPLIVSYCILCNSGMAFRSELDGRAMALRCVTAYNNNIIYLEPETGNFIQQLDGKVLHGPDAGRALVAHPIALSTWGEWKRLHPGTTFYHAPDVTVRDRMVAWMLRRLIPISKLSKRSGPWHRVRGELDGRLPAMSFVLGVEIDGDTCCYPVGALRRAPVVNDTVGGTAVAVFFGEAHDVGAVFSRRLGSRTLTFAEAVRPGTAIVARDQETGTLWTVTGAAAEGPLAGRTLDPVPHFNKLFWFSWALFKPGTRIHAAAS